ncbi:MULTISPECIES: LysR family transcriptional regulator [Hyphomicrobiales]|jgi:DNA-binding transcriptional LysR family regulator|uniref:LysR family transcriptional regulator n=1 Tax=Hyphomicrobiales TaxID=356 RepID=UPI000376DEBD|nr:MULTISPECIES: LysR family transcriptional regulator [Phyllobacteriaceae]MCX8571503.1 LysR family transcriptional regulator [Aminobacter sp. MET-1]
MSRTLIPVSLIYFDRVVTEGSIQGAARGLNIAASAIDRQIIGLEDRLNARLFERMPKGMRLTAAGEILIGLIRSWQAEESKAVTEIFRLQGIQQGKVKIFAMDSHASSILPRLVQQLAVDHPRIGLSVQIGSTDEAVAALVDGDTDLIVAFNLPVLRELRLLWNSTLPLGCVVRPNHPLLDLPEVRLHDVIAYPIALQSKSLLIRRLLETRYSWLFAEPRGHVETNSLHLVKNLARSGNYVALTSELDTAEELASGVLRFVPIVDSDAIRQTSGVAVAASKPLSSIVEIVANCAVRVLETVLREARNGPADG